LAPAAHTRAQCLIIIQFKFDLFSSAVAWCWTSKN
jgi:hypothetical protein